MTAKIAVSLPDQLVQRARDAIERGEAASVSAYVADALERRTRDDELGELLVELVAEYGRPSADDYAWAARALGIG